MVGLGWTEVLILLGCAVFYIAIPALVVVSILVSKRSGERSTTSVSVPQPPRWPASPVADEADARQTIIARLTQRFCPQCRSSLAPDAPEGLCPACLMAGGLASAAIEPPVNGLAATTPPSGSKPPVSGEWADLQRHFPDLEILELLGRGGMGTVYKARHKNLDRLVALKVIPPDATKDPAFTERFNREARAMARLNHANIVTVYDSDERNGIYYLLMEYVDGVNLRHTLRAGHLAPREALAIVPQVCDALQYAHDQGVVHRDIKPENVLLDRTGRVKIADFGLAKLLGKGPDDFTLTHTQQVMGTPRYMAPEQIERPSTVDHRADIYSLGVVLYEMLTGELPLGRFEPPSHKVEVDVRIDQVVLRALEKAPERRYQRASEVKTELASAASWPALASPAANPAVSAAVPAAPPVATEATSPVWHTPSPASKFEFWDPSQPGGVPLRYVLGVAIGMVMGILMITAGLAAGIYGLVNFPGLSGGWWGWMGGAFGCVVGGFGSLAGSYNSYRQLTGAEDLMRSPRVTWFDWVMRGYLVLGIAILVFGVYLALDVSNYETRLATLILGGIATFQGGLFVLWRTLIRPAAQAGTHLATSAERHVPAEPGYLRAVIWPSLAVAAAFGILLADVHFALPIPRSSGGITSKMIAYRQWYEAIVVTGVVAVPLCLLVLGVWRTWGPRHMAADGSWTVPFPFAHRAWVWLIAGLAALSLFLPWFLLDLAPRPEVVLRYADVFPGQQPNPGTVAVTVTDRELREIGAIPPGGRYAHRGLQQEATVAAAGLLILATVFLGLGFQAQHPGRIGFLLLLLVSATVALLLTTMLLHQAANQRERVVVDDAIETGLSEFASRNRGEWPRSIGPWKQAVAPAFIARPTIGAFALLAACGLAIFVGATELSWGLVLPGRAGQASIAQPVATPQKAAPADPARAAALGKVAGPAIGLMIVGVLGLLPILLAVLAVPAWTVSLSPQIGEPVEYHDSATPHPLAPPGFLPLVSGCAGPGTLSIASHAVAPVLLTGQVETSRATNVVLMAPIALIILILNLAFSITVIIGGWRMRQLKSYGLAVIAAVLALLPCTLGWFIGLPIGIWAFITLANNEVRDAFES
jgi:predicted Ser/Thr protein kinase